MAELACLYVHKGAEGQGYGRKLMAFAEQLAAERGMAYIFALSTQTYSYFQQKGGFVEVGPQELPEERRKRWEASNRNSKILREADRGARAAAGVRSGRPHRRCRGSLRDLIDLIDRMDRIAPSHSGQ